MTQLQVTKRLRDLIASDGDTLALVFNDGYAYSGYFTGDSDTLYFKQSGYTVDITQLADIYISQW